MAFEGLSEKLQSALRKMSGKGKLTEQNVKDGMREVRMALLEADVNYVVAKKFIQSVTEKCVGQEVLASLTPGQQVIKIVNEEMTKLMGGTVAKLTWSSSLPTIYMLCGLQGAGKTTMAAKLAGYLVKQGKKPMLAACDIYRPAAIKQLLVVDSMTGQEAVNVAKSFNEKLAIDGVILTKLDSDTRGGAALSVREGTGKPIKFSGIGEKLTDIEPFYPDRMASRILGMGDVLTLIDKAQEAFADEDVDKLSRKVKAADLTLEDFLQQMQSMKKMGGIKSMLGMIPGVNSKDIDDVDDDAMKKPEAIIRSMTPKERRNPGILNASRRKRIAAGSGTSVQEVNQLIRQFDQAKQMMKQMTQMKGRGRMKAMMKAMPKR